MTKKKILLFDVDRTLTQARQTIKQDMSDLLTRLSKNHIVAVVSGSDEKKVREQIGPIFQSLQWVFTENGLRTFKKGKCIEERSLKDELGEMNLQRVIRFCLKYIASMDQPKMRGTFIEMRTGMLNISPIGRNCSPAQRDQFELWDKQHQARAKMIAVLEQQFKDLKLKYSIGGQISFDVFPCGFDKTYCLKFIQGFEGEIHFFGDKTTPGGNDYQIYIHERTIGHSVEGPSDTIKILQQLCPLQ